jgi:hypothetical protein
MFTMANHGKTSMGLAESNIMAQNGTRIATWLITALPKRFVFQR